MTTLSRRGPLAAAALVTAALPFVAGPAHAVVETCDGRAATLVFADPPPSPSQTFQGTTGDDVIVVTYQGFNHVDGGAGNDTICGGPQTTDIFGGDGNDDIWSGPTAATDQRFFSGDAGDDVIHGTAAQDVMAAGSGNDTLLGAGGADSLAGDEFVTPTDAPAEDDDRITAGPGNDVVVDDWGDDTFSGGTGSDRLVLGEATDDPVDDGCFSDLATHAVLDVAAGTVTGFGSDTFQGFDSYLGGTVTSTLVGTSGPDDLGSGDCGTADLEGRGGADRLAGTSNDGGTIGAGRGADQVVVSGAYAVHLGAGDDRIQMASSNFASLYFSASRAVKGQVWGGPGTDRVVDDSSAMLGTDLRHGLRGDTWVLPIHGVENAREGAPLNPAHYYLIGTAGPNVLTAAPHAVGDPTPFVTILRGLGGNDRLLAGMHDTAYGGAGHDVCRAQHRVGCEAR